MAKANSAEDNSKLVAILSYFLVGIIWYFADEKVKGSSLAKFHVKQSLNLIVVSMSLSIVFRVLGTALFFIWGMLWWIWSLVSLALFVLWIFGLISAINSTEKEIPIVGQFADKYLKF